MTPKAKAIAIKALENDLGDASDNLHRARHAATCQDASKPYGQSGQTLQQIIDGYQSWYDESKSALDELRALL